MGGEGHKRSLDSSLFLSAFGAMLSSSSHHEDEDTISIPTAVSSDLHLRRLLVSCADLVSRSDLLAARRLLSFLAANSSPDGDSTERLVHHFTNSLSLRLSASANPSSSDALRSSFLSLNQITPFVRFGQLTANQAILEATGSHPAVHILDFDIMHGVQWPPLMQAIADRSDDLNPPPTIRITGTGSDPDVLRRTGDRLLKFAHSLGLTFRFHPLLLPDGDASAAAVALLPEEALAVNCVLHLHRLPNLRLLLHNIKSLNPRIVTVVEEEVSNHRHAHFMERFVQALGHYGAVFESLEATVPPNSAERMAVEQVWLGREIADVAAAHWPERMECWEAAMRSCGFWNVPLSPFALSQAKLLLRLHYPSEGYQINTLNHFFLLAWRTRTLFSVSSWR